MSVIERCGLVVLLAMFDIIFTLYHLSMGATEVNPFMAFCLQFGEEFFVIFKMLFTLLMCCVLMVCCTNDLRFTMVKIGLNIIIVVYIMLCLYHLYLFLVPSYELARGRL